MTLSRFLFSLIGLSSTLPFSSSASPFQLKVMGVEVAESTVPQVVVNGSSDDIGSFLQKAGNGKEIHGWQTVEPITFGSYEAGEETVVNGDANNTKDAVAEWPAPKQFHSFYLVKYRFYEDPKLKLKVEEGERKYQKINQERFGILDKLKAKRAEKTALNAQIEPLSVENSKYRKMFDDKKKEMEPLQEALGKLRGSGMAGGDRNGGVIYSSEEELNAVIKSLEYRISHDSIPLTEEKQILREIKQLEGTREKVIANSAMRAKVQESLGEKTVIQDQVKNMGGDLDAVKKEKKAIGSKISKLIEVRNSINGEIRSLEAELEAATKKRDEELEKLQSLRKDKDVVNGSLIANRALLNDARNHANNKDIEKLKELSETQVKNFISSWSNKKEFREDYERRILGSLDARQLSRDGRLRNPGEKPLIEASAPPPQVKPAVVKPPKEEVIISKTEAQPIVNVEKEVKKNSKPQKEAKSKQNDLDSALEPVVDAVVVKEKEIPQEVKIDEAKLKEIRREEEMAKSKQALERKKKLAEKAAIKAANKAQKDEEKRLKDREKKARKKAAASAAPADESDEQPAEAEVAEPEKVEEISEAPVSLKNKDVKDKTVRPRSRRPTRGTDSLPRAILKRRQSTNYWAWALPVGMAVLLLLLVLAITWFSKFSK